MKKALSLTTAICLCLVIAIALASCDMLPSGHEHDFSAEWSSDETHHWHICKGEDCTKTDGKAEHEWNEGEITTEPTETADGIKTLTCLVCSKTKTETVKYHEHDFNAEWSSDENYHWHACEVDGCIKKEDKTAHSWNAGEITAEPTENTDGIKTFTCSVCSKTKTEPVKYSENNSVRTTVTEEEFLAAIAQTNYTLTSRMALCNEEEFIYDKKGNLLIAPYILIEADDILKIEQNLSEDNYTATAVYDGDYAYVELITIDGETINTSDYELIAANNCFIHRGWLYLEEDAYWWPVFDGDGNLLAGSIRNSADKFLRPCDYLKIDGNFSRENLICDEDGYVEAVIANGETIDTEDYPVIVLSDDFLVINEMLAENVDGVYYFDNYYDAVKIRATENALFLDYLTPSGPYEEDILVVLRDETFYEIVEHENAYYGYESSVDYDEVKNFSLKYMLDDDNDTLTYGNFTYDENTGVYLCNEELGGVSFGLQFSDGVLSKLIVFEMSYYYCEYMVCFISDIGTTELSVPEFTVIEYEDMFTITEEEWDNCLNAKNCTISYSYGYDVEIKFTENAFSIDGVVYVLNNGTWYKLEETDEGDYVGVATPIDTGDLTLIENIISLADIPLDELYGRLEQNLFYDYGAKIAYVLDGDRENSPIEIYCDWGKISSIRIDGSVINEDYGFYIYIDDYGTTSIEIPDYTIEDYTEREKITLTEWLACLKALNYTLEYSDGYTKKVTENAVEYSEWDDYYDRYDYHYYALSEGYWYSIYPRYSFDYDEWVEICVYVSDYWEEESYCDWALCQESIISLINYYYDLVYDDTVGAYYSEEMEKFFVFENGKITEYSYYSYGVLITVQVSNYGTTEVEVPEYVIEN